jgi:hypothetical protein
MDGDKVLDIITTNGDLHILLNNLPQLPNGVSDVTFVPSLVYPNPAEDVLDIKTNRFDHSTNSNYSINSKYSIISLSGKVCQSGTLRDGQIDVIDLMPGFYFILMHSQDGHGGVMGRFVKR